jgi:hypothetical protein
MPGKRPLLLKRKRTRRRDIRGGYENSNAVTSGAFVDLGPMIRDRRTRIFKFFQARVAQIVADRGGCASTAEMVIIKRAVFKEIRCELFENAFLNGVSTASEEGTYLAWSNSLRLDYIALGIDRPQPPKPDLRTYIQQRHQVEVARLGEANGDTSDSELRRSTADGMKNPATLRLEDDNNDSDDVIFIERGPRRT